MHRLNLLEKVASQIVLMAGIRDLITQVLGKPPGGVEPSYRQRLPRSQRERCMVVRCSAIS